MQKMQLIHINPVIFDFAVNMRPAVAWPSTGGGYAQITRV